MTPLSDRQTEVLEFLVRQIEVAGRPPSQVEIAGHFGFGQTAARNHLLALAEKGYIEFGANSARGIRVLAPSSASAAHKQLPVVGRIAAGAPVTAAPNIDEWISIDPELFRPAATCLYRVHGNSMINLGILDGDFAAIRADPHATSGVLAVAVPYPKTDDLEVTLKRYRAKGGKVHLLSENDDQVNYAPLVYAAHEVQVLGRYVGLYRPEHRR